jgi:2-polyprenyl-3-methyl-5-hydroxy-6-metoxy-1,4-benzoquinol methylase
MRSGNISIRLAERGYRCVGVELRLEFLRHAQGKDDGHPVRWVAGDAFSPPMAPGSVDGVILGEILEHVADPARLLAIAVSLVRQGGIVICTTPNGRCLRYRDLPSYTSAAANLEALRSRQFGPAGEDHVFVLRPEEVLGMVPPAADARLGFAVPTLWNRRLTRAARSARLSSLIEGVSTKGLWRRFLCENMALSLRRK